MIDPKTLEEIRAMTPSERLKIGLGLMNLAWSFLKHLPPEERQRRLALRRPPWNPPPGPMEK